MTFASPPRSGKRTVCSSARLLPPPDPPDPPDIAPSPPCSLNKYKLHNRLDLNGTGSRRVSPYARVPSSLTVESLSWVGRGLCLHDVATHRRQATTLPRFRDRPITQRIHPSTSPNHYPSHAGFQITTDSPLHLSESLPFTCWFPDRSLAGKAACIDGNCCRSPTAIPSLTKPSCKVAFDASEVCFGFAVHLLR
ncbi:hypothetical protein AALP_AA3G237000 [Arabis alpina]|uniref:Uncharacterized protein n=1 Tax=Arabis alpina TaxID=50452 RepID=A0A087HB76_ARAAL|nr:hypothetical protein AALP_AA3G237000 [Arabis alpina]